MSAYGCEALDSPENTARHSFDIYNEQSGFSKDTVILPESVGATELGSEGVSALSEAPYKTSTLTYLNHSLYPSQVRFFFLITLVATSNDDLYESDRADEPGSEQGKALAETFCNNTTLTSVSHYYLPMNDILESTVTGLSDFHKSGLPLEHSLDNYHPELNLLNIDLPPIRTYILVAKVKAIVWTRTNSIKYIFYIHIDDHFKTFEQIRKKLDRYAMERGFAVRKGHTYPDDQCNRDAIVTGCKWHCNFSIGNTATEIRCSLIDDECSNCHMQGHNIRSCKLLRHKK
ncbi:hypothetical protein C2G38_2219208 [Gigaspora rosea]|uniref:Uncharacterized protein n=1 Tax=Gigaspora rosea TaxID=44941 RepID=A0A397UER2_9GLOM|nr:hypothetical protein C2G38_2219208 [Gigaspora rosea]